MRPHLRKAVLLSCILPITSAPPPTVQLQEAAETLTRLHPESSSTDLTLGRNWLAAERTDDNAQRSLVGAIPGHSDYVASYYPLQHGADLPLPHATRRPSSFQTWLLQPAVEGPHYPPTDSPAHGTPLLQTQRNQFVTVTPLIDTHFSELLADQNIPDSLVLPIGRIYARPPWLPEIYLTLITQMDRKRMFETREILVPDGLLSAVLVGRRNLFMARGNAYTIHLVAGQWGSTASRELIFKFHDRLEWYGKPMWYAVSFWATADHGSSLALLGVYQVSRGAFKAMTALPGVRKFNVKTYTGGGRRVYLVPERVQDEHTQST